MAALGRPWSPRGAHRVLALNLLSRSAAGRRRVLDVAAELFPPLLLGSVAAHELLYDHSGWRTWLLAQLLVWVLVLRRRAPLAVFTACLAVAGVLWAAHITTVAALSLLVALYTVATQRGRAAAVVAATVLEAGAILTAVRYAPTGSINDAVLFLSGLVAAALFLGTTLRARRQYLASVEDRAQRLERERAHQAELAANAERTRIAREMHDIVAHGLSVMIAMSEAATLTATTRPEEARSAMQHVASTGRASLTEMRGLLGVLRTDAPVERAPQPTLAGLDALLEDVRRTGLRVHLRATGHAADLPATVQTSAYRIVQEALTNVLKHADAPTAVTVVCDCTGGAITFSVRDDGRPAPAWRGPASGHGITGMHERVAAFGGNLTSGPSPTGWLVSGRIPLRQE